MMARSLMFRLTGAALCFSFALLSLSLAFSYTSRAAASTTTGPGWSVITPPNVQYNLQSVTCTSASDCWAVVPGPGFQTAIEHWDGTSWQIFPMADPNGSYFYQQSIACTSASNCWIAGYYLDPKELVFRTLIEHWDGLSWQIFDSPNGTINPNSFLNSVTCVSSSDCWAVGSNKSYVSEYTLIEHWDGASWSIVPSADPPEDPPTNSLISVTCVSSSDCWAVGTNAYSQHPPTIEHWNGNSWSLVGCPVPPGGTTPHYYLESVVCTSSTNCWAVGFYNPQNLQQMIERWDGNSWQLVSVPDVGDTGNVLYSATCASALDCWAVGYSQDTSGQQTALIERWDGNAWSVFSSPNVANSLLEGVTCVSAWQCWSVGAGNGQTLIEEYSPYVPPLLAIGSRKVHGDAGIFDINFPLMGDPAIECRLPGATGPPGSDYKIVFTFVNDILSCGETAAGSLNSGPNSNQCTVDLMGVANAQYVSVTLDNVVDSENNSGSVSATMGVLVGDTSDNRVVNSADVAQTKSRLDQTIDATNFRSDVNADGSINAADTAIVKQNSGTSLPP